MENPVSLQKSDVGSEVPPKCQTKNLIKQP